MINTTEAMCDALREQGLSFERYDHPPVATCEEAAIHLRGVEGAGSKNLFLRNKKGDRHFLVTVHEEKRVDLAALCEVLGVGRLSFASADRLEQHLGVKPGAVTILALVNDTSGAVSAYIDRELWETSSMQCHPMENTSTLVMSPSDIDAFLRSRGRELSIIDVPGERLCQAVMQGAAVWWVKWQGSVRFRGAHRHNPPHQWPRRAAKSPAEIAKEWNQRPHRASMSLA